MRQLTASESWHVGHVDLKTAFLQGEDYDVSRDVVCQPPAEFGLPHYMAARLKKAAYGMNDAPRRWWNRLDKSLRQYGLGPTRGRQMRLRHVWLSFSLCRYCGPEGQAGAYRKHTK